MAVSKDEAPTPVAGASAQPRNPISNDNPNSNSNSNPNPNPNPNPSPPPIIRGSKGKSCTGCTYYSSLHKAKSKYPTCVGFSRTIQQGFSVERETEVDASRKGLSLQNFKYACIGYSVYVDNKNSSADSQSQDKTAELPFCSGLEVVLEERASNSRVGQEGQGHGHGHVPASHKTEGDEHPAPASAPVPAHSHTPQPGRHTPPNNTASDFINRFQRSAGMVASGVARDLNKVANYVKEKLKDILN